VSSSDGRTAGAVIGPRSGGRARVGGPGQVGRPCALGPQMRNEFPTNPSWVSGRRRCGLKTFAGSYSAFRRRSSSRRGAGAARERGGGGAGSLRGPTGG